MNQEVILEVPANFNLPSIYKSLQPSEVARVLVLGSIAYETIQQETNKSEHESIYLSLKKEAAKTYEPQIQTLQKQISSNSELVTSLKQRLQNEEASRLDVEKRIREEERRNREDLLKEKELRISSLEQQVKTTLSGVEQSMRESSRYMTDGFQSFKEQILKNSGSQKKGAQGEAVFADYVQNVFGNVGFKEQFSLVDVGKEGHQGDLRMNWKQHNILWEVKNYTRNVNQEEVKKFLRDMETNKDISLGVMVSLTTGITGHQKSGNIDLEELRDGRMCIYINSFLKYEDPTSMLHSLKPFMETFLQMRKQTSVDQSTEAQEQVERFEHQRSVLLRLLQNHQESTKKFKNVIVNSKRKSEQIWVELTTEMRESENQVKLLLETLLDKTWTETMKEEVLEIPDYVFRYTDINMYNAKEREFLEHTMKLFKFSEDYTISAKVVKDAYKTLGYSEDTVNSMRPRVFNDSVWEKGKKDVKYLQLLA